MLLWLVLRIWDIMVWLPSYKPCEYWIYHEARLILFKVISLNKMIIHYYFTQIFLSIRPKYISDNRNRRQAQWVEFIVVPKWHNMCCLVEIVIKLLQNHEVPWLM